MASLMAALSIGSGAPHGAALGWRPELMWTHGVADAVLALAYFAMALGVARLVQRRRERTFPWVFWAAATFMFAGGVLHAMSLITLWQPFHGAEATLKGVASVVSVGTAVGFWLALPRLISMPARAQLSEANAALAEMVKERDVALEDLRVQQAQRREVEAALLQSQKLEAVGQLTGGIAHDFNNLLQAVAGNLELIARKPDDIDRVIGWSASALNAVERGRSLTGQLLAFSSKAPLDIRAVRLTELVTGVKDLMERAVAPLGQVRIERIDPTLNVDVDALQIELALLNLAFNARDAMPEGGTLTISADRRGGSAAPGLPAGDYVALTLRDDGIGMPPEVQARAFEPFFTTKGKGTGMGLTMAAGVARQAGGALSLESEEGKGTAVTLFLRVAAGEPRRVVGNDARTDVRADLTGCTIALIDDDPQVRASLVDTLRSAGAEVQEASDGAAGIALIERLRPDLLVVDFAMPGMTGADVVQQVRRSHPELPVLLVTGFADAGKLDAITGPGLEVLWKPFESHDFLARAAGLLKR
jgi:signal transduction histidine kinase